MLRKRQGQVVCLAPASSEGSVDGLGSVFAEAFGEPSKAEVEAAASIGDESEEGPEPANEEVEQPENAEANAEATDTPEAPTEQVAALLDQNKALAGQVEILTTMNDKLNAEKARLQVELDEKDKQLSDAAQANEALKPAAIRQIKTLSIALNQPVADDLSSMSATELGSVCATMLTKLKESVPAGQQSKEVPSGSDGEPTKAEPVSVKESGLSDF